ncbi:MAG: DUF433 domain-containing protein [Bacteroidota bacterium]
MDQIVKTPGVVGGSARIRNTRIPVWVLIEYLSLGWTVEKLLVNYPRLNEEQLAAAKNYYDANKDEIDADIKAQDAVDEE